MSDENNVGGVDLPSAVSYGVRRWESSSQTPKNKFDFPPRDIPKREGRVWALSGASDAHLSASFQKVFEGVARGGNWGSGAIGEKEKIWLSSTTLTMLDLDRDKLSPEQIIEQEERDWRGVRESLERWALENFGAERYLINDPNDTGDERDSAARARGLLAFWERAQLDEQTAAAPASARSAAPKL